MDPLNILVELIGRDIGPAQNFRAEDGGSMFLRNGGIYLQVNMA
jgi:hypothetical protein